MTTLKFGGFSFETGSISWNLVLRCLFLIAFFSLLISNPRWADYNGWLYGAWANRGSETGRLNSHKRTITPKLTKYLDIFNSESSSVHKKKPTNSLVDILKGCFSNCHWDIYFEWALLLQGINALQLWNQWWQASLKSFPFQITTKVF